MTKVEKFLSREGETPRFVSVVILLLGMHLGVAADLIFSAFVLPCDGALVALFCAYMASCFAALVGILRRHRWGWWAGTAFFGLPTLVLLPFLPYRSRDPACAGSWIAFALLVYVILPFAIAFSLLIIGWNRYRLWASGSAGNLGLWKRIRLPLIAGLLTLLMTMSPLGLFVIWPPRLIWAEWQIPAGFARRRDRYEAIAKLISSTAIEAGHQVPFGISPDRDPTSLEPLDYEKSEGKVYDLHSQGRLITAIRNPDGGIRVEFVERDFGHLGVFSILYFNPPPRQGESVTLSGYGRATKIESCWWFIQSPD